MRMKIPFKRRIEILTLILYRAGRFVAVAFFAREESPDTVERQSG